MQARERYHHGDLRSALIDAGVDAARLGGEQAVRLNQLAGQVGVSASAAYRHFPEGLEALLVAVGDVGRAELAARIQERMTAVASDDGPEGARARFRASGEAYVEYVTEQPGLFQVASRHDAGRFVAGDPHALLEACLDDLVSTGVLAPDGRPWASAAAWAAVHGLAVLLTEGALRRLPERERRHVVARTLDMVERGL